MDTERNMLTLYTAQTNTVLVPASEPRRVSVVRPLIPLGELEGPAAAWRRNPKKFEETLDKA